MRRLMFLVVAGVLGACATTPVPADKLANAKAAIRSAHEMNAEASPDAAFYLRVANEELAQAKQILKDGDNGKARMVLVRAEADADAALNIAREKMAVAEAQQTIAAVRQTKLQMTEGSTP